MRESALHQEGGDLGKMFFTEQIKGREVTFTLVCWAGGWQVQSIRIAGMPSAQFADGENFATIDDALAEARAEAVCRIPGR